MMTITEIAKRTWAALGNPKVRLVLGVWAITMAWAAFMGHAFGYKSGLDDGKSTCPQLNFEAQISMEDRLASLETDLAICSDQGAKIEQGERNWRTVAQNCGVAVMKAANIPVCKAVILDGKEPDEVY